MKNIFKRIVVAVAALAVLTAVPLMSGCESSHPEAVITVSYNDTQYELKYKLYRNMYPQTVKHFIELADSGFYNNTIIHSYYSNYLYGGGYTYNTQSYDSSYEVDYEDGVGAMREYYSANSKDKAYYDLFQSGALTPSVYKNWSAETGYTDALPSVIGEVGQTHTITNGALKGGFGALRMYYSAKTLENGDEVYIDKDNSDDGILVSYVQHSATSMFSIQTSTSTSTSTSYCIFGQLIETQSLTDLVSALSGTKTLTVNNVAIDTYDPINNENYATYYATAKPIIITSVKITKY